MAKARKRSRSTTEQSFRDAVLALIAESGFAHIGVNQVADRAGSDKVLIYRYFGDFEGLLRQVARDRVWLPRADELLADSAEEPEKQIGNIFKRIEAHFRRDPAVRRIARWCHAIENPLTEQFRREWKELRAALKADLTRGMAYDERKKWERASDLVIMMSFYNAVGETVDEGAIALISAQLEAVPPAESLAREQEDILPTNLL